MIKSWADESTQDVFNGYFVASLPPGVCTVGRRKLRYIHNAVAVVDLRVPPGNRLEKLKGSRKGQYSIRINKQYRVCFKWSNGHAYNVEIVDYH